MVVLQVETAQGERADLSGVFSGIAEVVRVVQACKDDEQRNVQERIAETFTLCGEKGRISPVDALNPARITKLRGILEG
jgi:hypothetical protein